MALEAVVFQQDPYLYVSTDTYIQSHGYDFQEMNPFPEISGYPNDDVLVPQPKQNQSSSSSSSYSTPEKNFSGDGVVTRGRFCSGEAPRGRPQKRRRTKREKNKEEMDRQRLTHIVIERNRRRQMNDYLSVLKSLMPTPYVQRGDQASIIEGAINFLKTLEHIQQSLEALKAKSQKQSPKSVFANSFFFPQYTAVVDTSEHSGKPSGVADVEVTVVESHANVKLLARNNFVSRQLSKIVCGFNSLGLTLLHLNLTNSQTMVLYSFSVKIEDECEMSSGSEIASAVQEMVRIIQEEAGSIRELIDEDIVAGSNIHL